VLTAGNEGCTLITQGFASRLGLLDAQVRVGTCDLHVQACYNDAHLNCHTCLVDMLSHVRLM
jgi:hypothetical protein